jgi:hypothetical protein
VDAATIDLRDIPEIEPEEDETLSQASAESLVPEPSLLANFGEVAAAGALLGQAPDLCLFAVPTQALSGHPPAEPNLLENPSPSVAPSSIAPTITDLDVISFAHQARRSQSTRVLLALAAVAIVGVGISVAVQGGPSSAALQPPQTSVAAARPATPDVQLEDLKLDRPEPAVTAEAVVTSSAAQAGSGAIHGQAPSAAPSAVPDPELAPRVFAPAKRQSAAVAPQPKRTSDEAAGSAETPAALEAGTSWLVLAQQQEAAKESSKR